MIDEEDKVFCITDYSPTNPDIQEIIMRRWEIGNKSSSTPSQLDTKIIFGHCKPKSLCKNFMLSFIALSLERAVSKAHPQVEHTKQW